MRTLNNQKRREDICALRKSRDCGTKQNARLVRISHEVILECDASRRRRSAMARRNLRIALSVCPSKHRTPNAELLCIGRSAMGDARFLRPSEWRGDLGEPLLRCDVGG